jgi:hypothetical protein
MGILKRAVAVVVVSSIVFTVHPVMAAQWSPVAKAAAGAPHQTVGSRIDQPIAASKSKAPDRVPYRVPDEAAFARAKSDAAGRAGGPANYRRNDFAIGATPSSQTVVQGSSTSYTVTTQATSGNAKPVGFSVSGLPAGATGTFNPTSVIAGGSSVLTIATTVSTAVGTVGVVITGTYSSPPTTHSTAVSLTVTALPVDDFSISASPAAQSVAQGSSATYTVSTQVVSGNAQTVALAVSGLPADATGTFSATSVTAGGSSVLTITTAATTPAGTATLVISGTYASPLTTHSATVTLSVSTPVANDFSISATPTSRSVAQGANTTYTINTRVTSGSAETVTLSLTGMPPDATGTFNPVSVTAGNLSTLTLTTAATTPTGTFPFTIVGISASATHVTPVTLEVTAAASGPTIGVSWNGQSQGDLAPPDPTGAIGIHSYIELINLRYGIYERDGTLIDDGDLGALTLFPVSELTDPQIVWDPTSQRYYYLVLDFFTSAYAFGYSKSADPQSANDFCHYVIDAFYGPFYLPDYPKLAVTEDFVLVGSNVFLLFSFYIGSDVNWFLKPTDPLCPAQLGPGGTFSSLTNVDGTQTSTPEPAVMTDVTSGGWIVGSADVATGPASYLTLFKVTKNAQGFAQLSPPMSVPVATYDMPANAPQADTTQLLDTMDTRLTHAVAGYDPRIDATGIWTAHTVFGGAGAEARWYEISTAGTPHVSLSGVVTDPDVYVFNGAISPDRAADDASDATATTGSAMVFGFNTSSASTYSAIQMVSQRGTGPQSGRVMVKQSVGPNVDFSCGSSIPNVCRWGDYGGATPDPLRNHGGQVWLSNEWNNPATDGTSPVWQTWNWSASP